MTDVKEMESDRIEAMHNREIQCIRKLASNVAGQVARAHIPPSLASILIGSLPHALADGAMKARGNIARACELLDIDLHDMLEDDFRRVWDSYNEYR